MGLFVLIVSAFSSLGTWLAGMGGAAVGLVTLESVRFAATKAFWLFVFAVIVPILTYNIVTHLIVSFMDVGYSLMSDSASSLSSHTGSLSIELTGIAGWIANQIYLPQAVSTYLSAISLRFVMSMIPFLR